MNSVLIVGASAAGLATAEALRRQGYEGELTVLGAERHLPYDRPPLSKQVLTGAWEPPRAELRTRQQLQSLKADIILGEEAAGCDLDEHTVTTASGRTLRADFLVIATGLLPRTLPGQQGLAGMHVLRTMDHAVDLRRTLTDARRLVIVGAGVLGAEIAASARSMGTDVTLTGFARTLMGPQIGDHLGAQLTRMHAERGVHLRLDTKVDEFTGADGKVTGVRLNTGELLPGDAVVVAVGGQPLTGWLEGTGLKLRDGVECDAYCRAAPGVYAVGDIASFHHQGLGRRIRLENRTNATEQAQLVAANILGAGRPYLPTPYFWTDQYETRIQVHGMPMPGDEVSIAEGHPDQQRFAALYHRDGRVTGVLGWNMAKQARLLRQEHLSGPTHVALARTAS
ncbi:NAD(P)/FAD-dependent oxidoreductase [Streptomyces sp. NPDC057539]|uniref:NAD(P)/FAD-dependent oxidoreductase n=1 Tax=Streptomyces sp. NPDC057539 TaxID=3346159 RepID=UPI00369C43FB